MSSKGTSNGPRPDFCNWPCSGRVFRPVDHVRLLRRPRPRVAAFTVIAAGAMVTWAIQTKPGGYAFGDIPDVFVQVVAKYLT